MRESYQQSESTEHAPESETFDGSDSESLESQIADIDAKVRSGSLSTTEADELVLKLESEIRYNEAAAVIDRDKKEIEAINQKVQSRELSPEEADKQVEALEEEIKKYEANVQPKEEVEDGDVVSDLSPEVIHKEKKETVEEIKDDLEAARSERREAFAEMNREYLEKKREYKTKKRDFERTLEERSGLKKAFRLGRKNLTPEEQILYDEVLAAEKRVLSKFC